MKNKKGFTLVEIIVVIALLLVVAGIFTVNMVRTLNKNKNEENENVVTQITAAAEAFVSTNPDEVEKLYEGYGYIDIPIGDLRNAGLLSEELKDAVTGVRIADEELVRVSLQTGDYISTKYPLTEEEKTAKSYSLVAEDLYVEYSGTSSTTWCNDDAKVYSGLFDPNVYTVSNYTSVTSKLYLVDNSEEESKKGAIYTANHRTSPVNLKKTSCNVNPQIAGSYTINYTFNDPESGIEKTTTRKVYVETSTNDVVSFTAIINNNRPIALNATKVPIKITEKYKDGTTKNIINTVDAISGAGYNVENFSTATVGRRTAKVYSKKTNSDGSTPNPADAPYTVTDNFLEIIKESPECTGTNDDCYFRGEQDGNYIKYYNKLFRIYHVYGSTLAIIYDGNYTTAPYGQLGECMSSCCNHGRYAYISLGDINSGVSKTMDSYLDDFYNELNSTKPLQYLKSQSFIKYTNVQDYSSRTSGSYYNGFNTADNIVTQGIQKSMMTKKVALLQLKDYKEIAGCTSDTSCSRASNYLTGTNFWLLDFYGARFGVGAYNHGVNAAEVYEYSVTSSGLIDHSGASKPQGSQTITTETLSVKPTLELQNPKIDRGTGTRNDPYIVKVG